jgi:fatty-acyl-CoA synthase
MFELDLLSERARVTPDQLALVSVESGERLNYAQLDARAWGAARALHAAGLRAGERFGVLSHNSVDYVALFFAAGRVGAVIVPLSTRATAHELEQIAADCEMKLCIRSGDFEEVALSVPVASFETMSESFAAAADEFSAAPHVPFDPEATYCLLYTSGTTGRAKGVMIPRRQLYWNGYNTAICWDLRADDVTPVFTPIYHAGGLTALMLPVFCAGGAAILHKSFNVSEVWKTIVEEKCTVVLGVPTIWKLLMEAPEFETADLTSVRWFISGGAPLPHYILDAYQKRGVTLKQGYGMTEVGVNCFTMTPQESYRKPGSIGRPLMFTAVRVVRGDGFDAEVGEVGEMWIRGPHLSLGYWNNPQATSESYLAGGWFRTGDLARVDEEGFFYIAGRSKDMFISGGVNVYPAEIEAALVAHPGVADAAVIAAADETWGEVGIAFVVATNLSATELDRYLTTRISKYKVPKRFIFVDSLPRTPYGKVVKEELRQKIQ